MASENLSVTFVKRREHAFRLFASTHMLIRVIPLSKDGLEFRRGARDRNVASPHALTLFEQDAAFGSVLLGGSA